ncbi:hypothetical protein [Lentilactobacillus hilgardii]|uniref:hypothetical protein n=1 Tax=Lentilactobacillus hilgardii TaxID=1588 RepID=UPI0021C3C072|nr:hypothetical protein [Lentilactobacillus hilgardii]MCP9331905.1 hypothetical protein [Lentilactobacillus hilgardii]MCP9348472.1 hypothetical protein [Lentilactobacillus hilgardii]MCP9351320.1 hypothetical protein [Lentilactobacillus hilgardii]
MKFSELESKVKLLNYESKWNFSLENRCDAVMISISKNGQGLYRIPNTLVGSVHEFGSALEIPEHDRLALQKLAYKYSRTPLDERRDEPKFRVLMMYNGNNFLNRLKENIGGLNAGYLLIGNGTNESYYQTIFTKSEYENIQQAHPKWLPKFDENDPHFELLEDNK